MTEQSLKEISNFIDETKIYYLATVDGDQPKNRPLGGHHIYDGRLMFTIGDHKNVYKQMQENPKVEIVAFSKGKWLRYTGKAVFETDPKYSSFALEGSDFLQNIYNDKTGYHLALFHLEDAKATLLDGGRREVKMFE